MHPKVDIRLHTRIVADRRTPIIRSAEVITQLINAARLYILNRGKPRRYPAPLDRLIVDLPPARIIHYNIMGPKVRKREIWTLLQRLEAIYDLLDVLLAGGQ